MKIKTKIVFFLCLTCLISVCHAASKASELAENDPEEFLVMLKTKVLDALLANPDTKQLKKYEGFISKIKNPTSREQATKFISDIKSNYSKSWHLMYPVKISARSFEIKGNPVAKRDLTEILRLSGVASLNTYDGVLKMMAPKAEIPLYSNVNYLDPLKVAVEKLSESKKFRSKTASSKNRIETAGIPLDTFSYHAFDLEHKSNQVNRLIFITDFYNRVIAVQELIESPKSVRLSGHTSRRSVYNFIQMRRKGTSSYRIAYRSSGSRSSTLVVMESELVGGGKPKEWVRLYVPKHIASVFMYYCTHSRPSR